MTRNEQQAQLRQAYSHFRSGMSCEFLDGPLSGRVGEVVRLSVAPSSRAEFLEARFHDQYGWFRRSIDPAKARLA